MSIIVLKTVANRKNIISFSNTPIIAHYLIVNKDSKNPKYEHKIISLVDWFFN
jgi:hypothetical protein